jgi:hypothetical protein
LFGQRGVFKKVFLKISEPTGIDLPKPYLFTTGRINRTKENVVIAASISTQVSSVSVW